MFVRRRLQEDLGTPMAKSRLFSTALLPLWPYDQLTRSYVGSLVEKKKKYINYHKLPINPRHCRLRLASEGVKLLFEEFRTHRAGRARPITL
jgi:hypothetical protein